MSPQNLIEMALDQTIDEIPDSPARRRVSGKVRDVFELPGDRLALVTTDRISVFDYVIGSIPFKGQVLNQLAGWWLRKLDDIGIPHQLKEGSEIDGGREGIDEDILIRAGHLDQAQLRIECRLPHELRIECHKRMPREACAGCGEVFSAGDQRHGGA